MNEKLGKIGIWSYYLYVTHQVIYERSSGAGGVLRDLGYMPEQVQDFIQHRLYHLSTCMYYTGYDCRTMEKGVCAINPHEKG